MVRKVAFGLTGVALLGGATLFGGAWYYSSRIHALALRVEHAPPELNLRVVAVGEGTITLAPIGDGAGSGWTKDGVWGIVWPDGFARAGRIVSRDGDTITRELDPRWGAPPIGERVRLTSFAYPEDPLRAHGLDYEVVRYPGPLGELTGWYVAGERDTWIIAVHGMGSSGGDALRLLGTTAPLGYPMLAVSYRNDEGAPASPSGRYDYGRSEWEDVEAAVRYARGRGARDVVLVGYSMGGGIVMSFMRRSELSTAVAGVILDAPMLDFGATIDYGGRRMNLPRILTVAAKHVSSLRHGVDWDDLSYIEDAHRLRAPVLLFHGDDDTIVPITTSEAFAAQRPDLVTYERFAGAAHVRAWNMDTPRYEAAVREFLRGIEGRP